MCLCVYVAYLYHHRRWLSGVEAIDEVSVVFYLSAWLTVLND